jgi:sulfide:quinone oxidoreductase
MRLLVDAAREEAGQLAPLVVEDAQRGVAGGGQVRGRIEDTVEDDIEIQLGQETASHVDESGKAALIEAFGSGHAMATLAPHPRRQRHGTDVPTAIRGALASGCGKAAATSHPGTDAIRPRPVDDAVMAGQSDRPRVVIAGGGVAALEACLALRERLRPEDLAITLVSPTDRFEYRPLAVLEPFTGISRWSLPLSSVADDQEVDLVRDALEAVGPRACVAVTGSGSELPYDALLIAIGGHTADAVHGAMTFRGPRDGHELRRILDEEPESIAFVAPPGATWPLPIYELALLAAADLRERGARTDVSLFTPERAPLAVFGPAASEYVADLLARREIRLVTATDVVNAGELDAERVVALPRVIGRRIEGVPRDKEDFIVVDEHARVTGLPAVHAAGDITNLQVKQGGLAARQADAAADSILAALGVPISPRPFQPVIQGVLFTDREPAYLQAPLGDATQAADPRSFSLWWPPSKIAGRHLSPYLSIRGGAPRAPEVRPDRELLAISVDVEDAVRSVRGVVDGDPVPPG